MIVGRIKDCTRTLGVSQGFGGLSIRDQVYDDGTRTMSSAWFPNPDEIAAIANGAPIYLELWGSAHPPVKLTVGDSSDPLAPSASMGER